MHLCLIFGRTATQPEDFRKYLAMREGELLGPKQGDRFGGFGAVIKTYFYFIFSSFVALSPRASHSFIFDFYYLSEACAYSMYILHENSNRE